MPVLCVTLFAACASKAPAPTETRQPGRPAVMSGDAVPVVARPGYYIVKKGDTLYSISHLNERDYREVAAWNGIVDPSVIKVGQELRVTPPGDMAPSGDAAVVSGAVAVAPAVVIDSTPSGVSSSPAPLTPIASGAVPSAAPVGQKTEPKGGRVAYSAQAWKDLQAVEKLPSAATSVPVTASVSTPVAQSQPAAQSKPAESKPVAAASEDEPDWVWPGTGKVLATFNDSSNKGVDLAGNIGDPVIAAGPGKVVYVGSGLRGYGNLVIIKHNNNFLSAYAHNSEILVKEGQAVQKGQKIAALGNSDTDRPKLHFEIRRQGKPVDPVKYLPPR
ncbi:peptidoglycan DD-metalloendopeptidase family protein [Uliginosibacterium flavum]|uniref:Peptidoglycan DD-metalloendopeptidase family protein n=2 Tax=Uliginosibacterium flavum TaxID=1396831 RepID=A0ABV2TME0_9RHOO